MKIINNIYIAFFVLFLSLFIFVGTLYNYGLSRVSSDDSLKEVEIKPGSVESISRTLYRENLIRSKLAFNIYVRLSHKSKLMAATYEFSENMGTKKIVDILNKGNVRRRERNVTFREGLNIRQIANIIEENTEYKKEDLYELISDDDYLNRIIEEYWFLDDKIKNPNIYYSLEGYLYPNTYAISKDDSLDSIIKKMLDETDKKLSPYKEDISNSSYSLHEILTLASIAELEGSSIEDRRGIVSVLYNRLNTRMTLGCDVTTFYGAKVTMGERKLEKTEVNACNNYNTRCATFNKLPISPICNSSIETVEAVIKPMKSDYIYFVSDINKKVYFSKNASEHDKIIYKLKKENLWFG